MQDYRAGGKQNAVFTKVTVAITMTLRGVLQPTRGEPDDRIPNQRFHLSFSNSRLN